MDLQKNISLPTSIEDPADKQYLAELCIGWPPGLRIFLRSGYDLNRNELLSHAISSRCCESVQVLLNDTDTALDSNHVRLAKEIANPEIFKSTMHSLAERRRKLQALAERHLPDHIQAQLFLPKQGVLDTNAIHVYSKLQASGVHIDPCLEVSRSLVTAYDWIYHDVDAAKMLFEAGFQNLEVEEDRTEHNKGLTTLMRLARYTGWFTPIPKVLETMLFLISKGADPDRRRRGDGRTAIHFLGPSVLLLLVRTTFQKLGAVGNFCPQWDMLISSKKLKAIAETLDQELSPMNHISWSLLETVFVDCHSDACSCACSAQGCLPSTCFFRKVVAQLGSSLGIQAIYEVIHFLGKRWRAGSVKDLNDTLAPTIFRICIFEHLELTHACCQIDDKLYEWQESKREEMGDDLPRILNEQRFLIEQVEDQTAFFLSKYHEMDLGLPEFLLEYLFVEITKDPKAGDETKTREYEQEVGEIRRLGVVLDELCT